LEKSADICKVATNSITSALFHGAYAEGLETSNACWFYPAANLMVEAASTLWQLGW